MARAAAILAILGAGLAAYLFLSLPEFLKDLRLQQIFGPAVFWVAIGVTAWGVFNVLARKRPGLKLLAAGIMGVLTISLTLVQRANDLLSTDDLSVAFTSKPGEVSAPPIDALGQTLLQLTTALLALALGFAVIAALKKAQRRGA